MPTPTRILLLVRSRQYRDSLAALLSTLEGVELSVDLLKQGDPLSPRPASTPLREPALLLLEDCALLEPARRLWPRSRTLLLVERQRPPAGSTDPIHADLTLPKDITAGQLLSSIRTLIQSP